MDYTRIYEGAEKQVDKENLEQERARFEEAMENYSSHMLGLKSVKNARDLGGYYAADEMRVREGMLIRTGSFADLSMEDEEILYREYHPAYIVDMRSEREQKSNPDKPVRGAVNIGLNLLEDVTVKRFDELAVLIRECEDSPLRAAYLAEYASLMDMRDMYSRMVREEKSLNGLKKFFSLVLNDEAGCVIWHCSSGKDRSGLAAALLLYALGCSMETIRLDYYTSNVSKYHVAEKYAGCMYDNGYGRDVLERLYPIIGVDGRYIDMVFEEIREVYGSIDAFLEILGLGEKEVEKLREKYLVK